MPFTSSHSRRLLAATASAGLVLGGLVAVATPASAASRVVTAGEVTWGVKASFRSYVTGPIALGSIATSGGATRKSDGTFGFPAAGGGDDRSTRVTQVGSSGSVRFRGHADQLDVTISDVRVQLNGDVGVLIADVASKGLEDGTVQQYPDTPFAELDASDAVVSSRANDVTLTGIAATLTEEGAPAFAGFYEPGTELDPVSLALQLGPGISGPSPRLTPWGTTTTITGNAAPGATVVVNFRKRGESAFAPLRTVTSDGSGRWSTTFKPADDHVYFAQAQGLSSGTVLHQLAPVVSGAADRTVRRGSTVTLSGRGTPGSAVFVHFRRPGDRAGTYPVVRSTKVATNGVWTTTFRPTVDHRLYVSRTAVAAPTTTVAVRVR